nr:MAG TPA: hypothetical protein [Caudoviricetes sp.]
MCKMILTLFDGGAEGAGANTAAGTASSAANAAFEQTSVNAAQNEGENGNTSAQEGAKQKTPEEREAEFQRLIKQEYKDIYTKNVNRIVKERFNDVKELKANNQKMTEVINMLSDRYGTADPDSLIRAINNDKYFFEDAAVKQGLTVEQYKEIQNLKRNNEILLKQQQQAEEERKRNEIISRWKSEAENVKNIYPGFDFETELSNPKFTRLLGSGVNVKTAFEALHMDDIMGGAMAYTANKVSKKVTDNIRARGARPVENGSNQAAAATVKNDVTKLTAKDRAEIVKRVQNGEKISF